MHKVVLVRHGESQWNLENRFTGWTDVDLSDNGISEAVSAGKKLSENSYKFDVAFTTVLKRAIRTLWIIMDQTDHMWIPINNAWELNERHYGALQGLNKKETAIKYGDEQVHIWRRSYDVPPPPLSPDEPRYPGNDPRYENISKDQVPLTESLKDTLNRVMPYWVSDIAPVIKSGKKIIIAAHGNSLRALIKYLENIPDEKITEL